MAESDMDMIAYEMPNRYWKNGLQDAVIKRVVFLSLNSDYTQKNPIRSFISFEWDAQKAMFETAVRAIKLYHVKVLSKPYNCEGCWWVSDCLERRMEKYILYIQAANVHEQTELIYRFEHAEVIRN